MKRIVVFVLMMCSVSSVAHAATGPATVTSNLRPTAMIADGQYRSNIIMRNDKRVRMTFTAVYNARTVGRVQIFVSGCWTEVRIRCADQKTAKYFTVRPGRNRIRWRMSMRAPQPINTMSVNIYDEAEVNTIGFATHIVRE